MRRVCFLQKEHRGFEEEKHDDIYDDREFHSLFTQKAQQEGSFFLNRREEVSLYTIIGAQTEKHHLSKLYSLTNVLSVYGIRVPCK